MAPGLTPRSRRFQDAWLTVPAVLWLVIFFLLPLGLILIISFLTRGTGGSPELPFTLTHYDRTFNTFGIILQRSLWIAFLTTCISLVVGYPMAFFIRTRRRRWVRQVALFLVILPFWTNFLVRTYAWRMLLAREGIVNELLMRLGLADQPVQLLNTEFAVLVGLVYGFLPFMVLPIYASIERYNFRYTEAAYDLGASPWQMFWRVMLPMTLPGVIAGCALVFIPAIGAFVTPDLLGGREGLMIGNLVQSQFKGTGNLPLGSALSVVILILVIVPVLAQNRMERRENRS